MIYNTNFFSAYYWEDLRESDSSYCMPVCLCENQIISTVQQSTNAKKKQQREKRIKCVQIKNV